MLFHKFKETPIFSSRTPLLRTLNLPPARFPRSHLTSESFVEFSICSYERTGEQSNKRPGTPYRRVRLARFARVTLLRHALPISLLILRKKTDCFSVQSRRLCSPQFPFLLFSCLRFAQFSRPDYLGALNRLARKLNGAEKTLDNNDLNQVGVQQFQ